MTMPSWKRRLRNRVFFVVNLVVAAPQIQRGKKVVDSLSLELIYLALILASFPYPPLSTAFGFLRTYKERGVIRR